MIEINSRQHAVLAAAALRNLEIELFRLERRRSPQRVMCTDEDGALRACIRLAIARADLDGFTERSALIAYVQVALDCGIGFATDPLHRWAAPALQSKAPPAERGQILLRAMMYASPLLSEGEWRCADSTAAFLERSLQCASEGVPEGLPIMVLRQLQMVLRGVSGLSASDVQRLFEVAATAAQRNGLGLAGSLGTAVFLLPVVLFGHECIDDPRYALIQNAALSLTGKSPDIQLKAILGVVREHIAENLEAAALRPQSCALPTRVLPTSQRLQSISVASTLPASNELRVFRAKV